MGMYTLHVYVSAIELATESAQALLYNIPSSPKPFVHYHL